MMKYSHYRGICLFVFILLLRVPVIAQSTVISGRVITEDTRKPLDGAVVTIKTQRKLQAITDENGDFSFNARQLLVVLVVSYTGFETQEIRVAAKTGITILLKRDNRQLDEVVVTGYGTQNRKFIAGSISSVSGNDIRDIPEAGFNQLLQGKATGVQVTANSGVPGGGITFRVRGNNSINASVDPLYVIDGVFISNADLIQTGMGNQEQSNPLSDINPADIESIQILKDANATAIYGSQGANGVIIVTTKRGRLNAKPKLSFNAYHGWSNAIKEFKVTTGPQTAALFNESAINTAIDKGLNPASVTLAYPNPDTLPTYNRIKDIFRTAATSDYELSVQGGTDKSTYYAGIGYLYQQSIVRPSNFERYTARLNYDNYITTRLKVGTSINITRTWRNVSSNDNNPQGVINSALFPKSFLPVYNADGTYARYGSFDNQIALIKNLNNNAVGWRTIGNLFGEYSFLPELKLRTSWSIDNNDEYENDYANTLISAGIATNGSATSNDAKSTVFTNEQVLTYIKSWGSAHKHNINALIGNTLSNVLSQNTSASGTGFATNSLSAISVAATTLGSSSKSTSKLVSFFGKASYTYDNKYTIDASLRADASSKFGINKRWGYFPSGGITWNAGQESFIQQLHLFDDLKLRGSLGLSGNQNGIGAYAAQGLWSAGYNYLNTAGTAPTQLANPNLSWETTRQVDVGIEFSVLKSRLNAVVDYYNKYTYDLLLNVPVPSRSGFTSYLQNYGAIRNKGVEISLHSVNISTGNFKWQSDFNVSFNTNRIEKLASDIAQGASGRNISILRQGYPVNSFWLYKQLSVDPQTGNAIYQDVNKDNSITSADRQIVGNALPKYTGGFNNTLTYHSFDLSFLFYFSEGNKIMNMNDFFLIHGGTQANIGFVPRQLDRWQKAGDITDIPRLTTYSGNPSQNDGGANNYGGNVASLSTRYLEDGSFIRLKTLTLGYTLPPSAVRKIKLNSVRAYVQATNVFTITKYLGLDPEISSQSNNQNTAGYDWATVPQPRTLQVGLNVIF
jgi:TonB-linked SusC/RagA family outer membrane protein